ncbi:hypothetical protein C9F11_10160 [Streptomyces sp. YIM 121038]|uniref:hypothetical protein n=1 Tax=Streptomyces sp. YIM 121038 TaxID=2136401 RepID=UPI001110C9BA|nr:hypothetical protein [Streptomyces sp. YIM 121038]QCX75712.1 hypothetical protein C9F11_10160 [Streptomyces sp. YIM 121038]
MSTSKKTAKKAKETTAAADAAKAEATEGLIVFEHRGLTFELPHPLDMPLELLETDDEVTAIRLMLGDEQWQAYKATRPKVRDFGALVDAISEAQGGDDETGN